MANSTVGHVSALAYHCQEQKFCEFLGAERLHLAI